MSSEKQPYSRRLFTPRSDIAKRDPEINVRPLLDSQRLKRIHAVYESSGQAFDDKIEAASEVGHLVRHTLWFRSAGAGDKLLSPDQIAEKAVSNCYGLTIVGSELLDRIGVEHCVSYANKHVFLTVPDPDESNVFMVDPAEKDFYLDIRDALGGKKISEQIAESGVAHNTLHTDVMLAQSRARKQRDELLRTHPWLSHSGAMRQHHMTDLEITRDMSLRMVSYPSAVGRDIIEKYSRAKQATVNGALGTAVDELIRLTGNFLELDTRNNQDAARELVTQLVREERYDEIGAVAASFAESVPTAMEDSNNQFFSIDAVLMIGDRLRNVGLLRDAADAYVATGTKRGLEKARKAQRIIRFIERN